MNPSDNDLPRTDQDLLDILADAELPDDERRELLARLDRTPGGWRACALAFLEAQCLRESLGKVAAEPAPRIQATVPRSVQRSAWARRVGTVLAMAASFLATLGLGWWAGGLQRGGGPDHLTPNAPTSLIARQQGPAVSGPVQPADPARPIGSPDASPMMTLALPEWGGSGPIEVPVVERDQLDPSLLYPDAHAFPAPLREALRRAGYQVRQSRELLPVPVQDGRHAILPVDQLDIHYVGNHVE